MKSGNSLPKIKIERTNSINNSRRHPRKADFDRSLLSKASNPYDAQEFYKQGEHIPMLSPYEIHNDSVLKFNNKSFLKRPTNGDFEKSKNLINLIDIS